MAEQQLLTFRAGGRLLAAVAGWGARFRPVESLLPAPLEALPLRGVLPPLLPLVDLVHVLTGEAGDGVVALETPTAGGPVAFLVEEAVDVCTVPGDALRALPPLL